jgi:hypothetical protein
MWGMVRIFLFALISFALPAAAAGQDEGGLLLNPKALAAKPAVETPQQMRMRFSDPPAEYRSMPLWVWNDELDWDRLRDQLAQFKSQGMGGVFIHPRPGLMTEYLGKTWFDLWHRSLEEGKRLGMLVNIYDENTYPAGIAGGLVPARAPDTAAQYITPEFGAGAGSDWSSPSAVAVFAIEKEGDTVRSARRITKPGEAPPAGSVVVFRLTDTPSLPWTGGFPYVDVTNPETAPLFLETTYQEYKQRFGSEFGKSLRWAFQDEPFIDYGYASAPTGLALSYRTLAEFRRRYGYDLADHLASLYWDVGDYRRARFDYWQLLHDLWKENYFRPIFEWCDRNGLQFTGHWYEHEWPFPWRSPADASFYAFEHMPGIDMLARPGAALRTQGAEPHYLFTIKQAASVSHQLGRRTLCEAYGVSGWDSTFEQYKRVGDWVLVHGVDLINQHLSFVTMRGARKRDHPQSFSDVAPWWKYYRLHADHIARASYMMSRGRSANRVVLLEPTTSAFLLARRGAPTPELDQIKKDNGDLIQFLADRQVDFDLLDEYILEWFGKAAGRRLEVGRAAYDLVVWPRNLTNVRRQTIAQLEKYLAAGGEVLALADPARYVDGRQSPAVVQLRDRYARQWHAVSGLPELLAAMTRRLPPRLALDPVVPSGLGFSERFLDDGSRVVFLANSGLKEAATTVTVEGGSVEHWDTVTGRVSPVAVTATTPGHVSFALDLPTAASTLLVVRNSGPQALPAKPPVRFARLETSGWKIVPESKNVAVLDYCNLQANGVNYRDLNTWRANLLLWQAHGFQAPAWDGAVQFRTRVFDRNHFPPSSGFEATFQFDLADPAAADGLELALESTELYRVTLNGAPLSTAGAVAWLDPHLGAIPVGKLARAGLNIVQIFGRPFDVRMELENIYLRGNFALRPAGKGFRLHAPARLDFGSWAKQGYPFYGDSVLYETAIRVPAAQNRLRVELGRLEGSVAEILQDGKRAALLGWPPYEATLETTPGPHVLGVRIVSTPRNLLGPFYDPANSRMNAPPVSWERFPDHQPAGSEYDLLDYGLMAPPHLSVGAAQE